MLRIEVEIFAGVFIGFFMNWDPTEHTIPRMAAWVVGKF